MIYVFYYDANMLQPLSRSTDAFTSAQVKNMS